MTAVERLDAIRARAEAATEGPWERRHFGYVFASHTTELAHDSGYDGTPIVDTFSWVEQGDANAEFIAHAREDVPAMEAALRAVLELHLESHFSRVVPMGDFCDACGYEAPCPTVRAIEGALS